MRFFRARFFQILSAFLLLTIVSCSTPKHQALRKIEVGMDKAEVLDLVGNPSRISRQHGQDRWAYEVSDRSSSETTYIYFADGRVTYIGNSPELSKPTATTKLKPTTPGENFKPIGN